MTDKPSGSYRPSGLHKGTHLRGAEITERLQKAERIWHDKLKFLHFRFHCTARCAAPLASVVYGKTRVETSDVIYTAVVATLTCENGHVTEERLE